MPENVPQSRCGHDSAYDSEKRGELLNKSIIQNPPSNIGLAYAKRSRMMMNLITNMDRL